MVGTVAGGGTNSVLNSPVGITTDGTNLYVADSGNNRIVSIAISTGTVTQLAGSSTFTSGSADSSDGAGATATFWYPAGIYYDSTNNILYVADMNNNLIRTVDPSTGLTSTIASTNSSTSLGSSLPMGLYVVDNGNGDETVYVADTGDYLIRQIDITSTGTTVSTLSGIAPVNGVVSKYGTKLSTATYYRPEGITADPNDSSKLYVTGTDSNTIRQLNLGSATVSTLIGRSSLNLQDGTGTASLFHNPNGITTDGKNTLRRRQGQ